MSVNVLHCNSIDKILISLSYFSFITWKFWGFALLIWISCSCTQVFCPNRVPLPSPHISFWVPLSAPLRGDVFYGWSLRHIHQKGQVFTSLVQSLKKFQLGMKKVDSNQPQILCLKAYFTQATFSMFPIQENFAGMEGRILILSRIQRNVL